MLKKYILPIMIVTFLVLCVASCSFPAKKDKTAPVFTDAVENVLPTLKIAVKTKTTETDLLKNINVTDNVDNEVTVVVDLGEFDYNIVGNYTITYTASDKAGNVTRATRVVSVVDEIAPYFSYEHNNFLPEYSFLQYTEVDLEELEYLDVVDNYNTGIKAVVDDLGGFDYEVSGDYTVVYKATDSSGNVVTVNRLIHVLPAIKYTEDVVTINGKSHPAIFNMPNALQDAKNGYGMRMRTMNVVQIMTKNCYVEQLALYGSDYAINGNVPFLPYGVVVVTDSELRPVLVRNATYGIEAVKTEDGWVLNKSTDLTFIDSLTQSSAGVGILGGNLVSYIPEGGYVLLAGAPKGGALDTAKIFLINNTISAGFTGGALTWDLVETSAFELLPLAQFSFVEDYTTIYPKPDDLPAPVLTMNNHVLTWAAIEGAKEYQLYIDGEYKLTTTELQVKMIDLELEPSAEGECYVLTLKAITEDIRNAGDSEFSEALEYVMPNAEALSAPVITLEGSVLSWEAITNAYEYEIYVTQIEEVLLLTTSETEIVLSELQSLNSYVGNAKITVKAKGNGIDTLDSEMSEGVIYFCSEAQVLEFGSNRVPVIVTTTADYFARRNITGDLGYVSQNYVYLITDAHNITASNVEAFSFLVLFDSEGNVKAIINILNTTNQYLNGEWVTAASINYTTNSNQTAPLIPHIEEGDQLLIGRTGGAFVVDGLNFVSGRDVLAHFFWGKYTEETLTANQPWRSEHVITEFVTLSVVFENQDKLAAPVFTLDELTILWDAVEGAEEYDIYINDELEGTTSNLYFDIVNRPLGKTGAQGTNVTQFSIGVVAKAQDKESSIRVDKNYTVEANLTDGVNVLPVNIDVLSALYNGGSGASCRLTDNVSTVLTGASYKAALDLYVNEASAYANNAYNAFMQNGIIVVLGSDMKVKTIRFGYATAKQIDNEYNITNPTTWNNNTVNATTGGGNFLNLENEVLDSDIIVIVTNSGSKAQLTAAVALFVNSNTAAVIGKTAIDDQTLVDTRVDLENTTYEITFTSTEVE